MAFSSGSTARHLARTQLPFLPSIIHPFTTLSFLKLTAVTPQIARVNAAPTPFSQSHPTGFLLYHQDVDPTSALTHARCGDAGPPCVARLDEGWCAEDSGDMMRTVVDADLEEWGALWSRRWQMYLDGIWPDKHHDDAERWARLDSLRSKATFFADATQAPEVLRLIAR